MELYRFARPELFSGKKVMYVHGFASSAQSGTVGRLSVLLPYSKVIARDLPVEPGEALAMLREMAASEQPDLIVGTSMGGMLAEMLYGFDRILVNPAFQIADTILKNIGLGRKEFHNPRADGQTSFLVTKTLTEHFASTTAHCFEKAAQDRDRVFGLFGINDPLVHTFDLFRSHYPNAIRFDGEHRLNDDALVHSLLPVMQWIDDRQNGVSRRVLYISLGDRIVNHSSGIRKAVETLSRSYDVRVVAGVPYNEPERCPEVFRWCEGNIGVPVWNRVVVSNSKDLLLGDYLIDAEPEEGGGNDFPGTVLRFGDDPFRTWEDVLVYFDRLGGQ